MKSFYLFPEDLGDNPSVYECRYLQSSEVKESKQELWIVEIFPDLPDRFRRFLNPYEKKLIGLGIINDSWSLDRIGEFGFIVDVFLIRSISQVDKVTSANAILRFGTASINDTQVKPSLPTNQ